MARLEPSFTLCPSPSLVSAPLPISPIAVLSCRSCQTRPHYGLTKGRAVYCATHKKDGMVHLLKESIVLEKERAAWCVCVCVLSVCTFEVS